MTRDQILKGLKSGKVLTQNKDCSTAQELATVQGLADDGLVTLSAWDWGTCRACGFGEMQRTASYKKPEPTQKRKRAIA